MQIQLRFTEGTSDKFWRVSVDGAELVTAWGQTGTDDRFKTETFPSAEHAESAAGGVRLIPSVARAK